jgi:hypothetical protein
MARGLDGVVLRKNDLIKREDIKGIIERPIWSRFSLRRLKVDIDDNVEACQKAFSTVCAFIGAPHLSRSFHARSFGTDSTFVPTMLFILCAASLRIRRFMYIYYTWETLLIVFLRTFGRRRPPTINNIFLHYVCVTL